MRNLRDDILGGFGKTDTLKPAAPVIEQPTQAEVKAEEVKTEEVKPQPQEPIISAEKKAEYDAQMKADLNKSLMEKPKYDYQQMSDLVNTDRRKREAAELEEKRRNRARIFNAIGDGVSALSNLYFTTKGAPSVQYDPRASLSARSQARWDEIDKARNVEAEKQYLRDKEKREEENRLVLQARNESRQRLNDAAAAKYREQVLENQRKQQEDAAAYRKQQREDEERRHQEILTNNIKIEQIKQSGLNQRAEKNVAAKKENAKISAVKTARGKHMDFSDGKDNQVRIYETVWKGSMPQVYEAMKEDGISNVTAEMGGTAAFERFIKQNWTKSPKARSLMLALSQIDPASSINEVEDDEDFSQYEIGADEDFSQYEIK